jgi:hypothetical protein
MQWKQMQWPILIDSLNLLELSAVPITLLVDEQGIVRSIRPSEEEFQAFLRRESVTISSKTPKPAAPDLRQLEKATRGGNPDVLGHYADALVMWGGETRLPEAIQVYERRLKTEPLDGPTHFRLGVANRKRYDSSERQPGDFAKAVEHWGRALDIDPNQYIWRRRIQQYGPRLAKPYSFYDWITQARLDIAARGETPAALSVEPGGAEFAYPAESFQTLPSPEEEPDRRGRIRRDEEGFVRAEVTVVPSVIDSGDSGRVHVTFKPNAKAKGHWNNEANELVFWVNPPEGWEVNIRYLTVPIPPEPVSQEARRVEFELQTPAGFTGPMTIPTYALYYVCEDVNGTCLFRRQDVPVEIEVIDRGK